MGDRRQFLLWIAAAAVALCALLAVLAWEQRNRPTPRSLYLVGDPQRGKALFYGEKRCSTCHSINGSGGSIAPDLSRERPGTPAMGWLAAKLWDHLPAMSRQIRNNQPYPQMTSENMADMLAFLFQSASAGHPGEAVAGERIFTEKGCASCHAAAGGAAPNLSNLAPATPDEWMRSMWNHTHSMVGPVTTALGRWPEFRGEEMSDLVAYLTKGNSKREVVDDPGSAARGWVVFQAQCLACHSVGGHGGNIGPAFGPERDLPLNAAEFAGVLWNHAPAMLKRAGEDGIAKPVLQGSEMTDLASFLASLRYVEPGGSRFVGERVFAERGCAQCHGSHAEGGQFGPRLGSAGDAYTVVSFTAALWKHGPQMVEQVQAMNIPWPSLKPADIGNLIAFLNGSRQ
jgi:mono/diheme cytochrome c family protein